MLELLLRSASATQTVPPLAVEMARLRLYGASIKPSSACCFLGFSHLQLLCQNLLLLLARSTDQPDWFNILVLAQEWVAKFWE